MIFSFIYSSEHGYAPFDEIEMINKETFLSFFGTAIYAYEGIGIVVPIMDETKDKLGFSKIVLYMITLVTVLYLGFGLIGYFTYGPVLLDGCPLVTKCLP